MRMVCEAVILAGGLGTRLRSEVPDLPKCMAPVAGRPFLDHVITYLLDQGITKIVFSLGYRHETIVSYLATKWPNLDYDYTIETTPLGTGGGILLASSKIKGDSYFVLNGDTYFDVNLLKMQKMHQTHRAEITIALKKMKNFDRYGTVVIANNKTITAFQEKSFRKSGLINGGIYLINTTILKDWNIGNAFSFEKEILEKFVVNHHIYGYTSEGYFIDIGIPEDFKKANNDFM